MEDPKKQEDQDTGTKEEIVPEEFLIKHPLQNCWTLWYFEDDKTKSWGDNQREIYTFDTIEDFWSLYNNIKKPSELKTGSDYALFKKGVRPEWEDPVNINGGRWVIALNKNQKYSDLDKYWLEIILCMIGESFDHNSNEICGSVVNIKYKLDKISLWIASGDQSSVVSEIGHKVKDQLKIPKTTIVTYQKHEESRRKN